MARTLHRDDPGPAFEDHIGPLSFSGAQGHTTLSLEIGGHHTNCMGSPHGGFLMAVVTALLNKAARDATGVETVRPVSLSADFLRSAAVGDRVTGTARTVRRVGEFIGLKGTLATPAGAILNADGLWQIPLPGSQTEAADSTPTQRLPEGYAEMTLADPFERHLGPFYTRPSANGTAYAFRTQPHHRNTLGQLHAGMLMTFADAALGDHVLKSLGQPLFVTVNQLSQMMGPAPIGAVVEVTPALISRADSLLVTEGLFSVQGTPVMTARSLWKVMKARPSSLTMG